MDSDFVLIAEPGGKIKTKWFKNYYMRYSQKLCRMCYHEFIKDVHEKKLQWNNHYTINGYYHSLKISSLPKVLARKLLVIWTA